MGEIKINRRKLLSAGSVAGTSTLLSGCDAFDGMLGRGSSVRDFMEASANGLSYRCSVF